MELHQIYPWWVTALLTISIITECQSEHFRGYGTENSQTSSKFYSHNIQREIVPVRQQSVEPITRPPIVRAVVVKCHADALEVVVQADLFDTGVLVDGGHLHLGSNSVGNACKAVPFGEAEFTIQAHLTDCGNKLSSTEEYLIYSNVLVYSPEPTSDGVLRLEGVTIPVECHYEKKYAVDSAGLHPTWAPFASTVTAEDHIEFNLRLMTDDWQFKRGSNVYFLGDHIHLEASAVMGHHMPLRVYVDHCFATVTPDADATLRYDFIEHHGCIADAYLTGSSSRFLPRDQENKLRFQMDAFRFYQESSNLIYITCYLRAVPATLSVYHQNRACSFIDNRWQSIDGNDLACRSCDMSLRFKEPALTEPPTMTTRVTSWPTTSPQGPAVWPKHNPISYFRVRPDMHRKRPPSPHAGVKKRGTDSRVEWTKTVHLEPLVIFPSYDVTTATVFTTTQPDQHSLRL